MAIMTLMDEGSLPSWECGLKFVKNTKEISPNPVTPLVGVWIEILPKWCYTL